MDISALPTMISTLVPEKILSYNIRSLSRRLNGKADFSNLPTFIHHHHPFFSNRMDGSLALWLQKLIRGSAQKIREEFKSVSFGLSRDVICGSFVDWHDMNFFDHPLFLSLCCANTRRDSTWIIHYIPVWHAVLRLCALNYGFPHPWIAIRPDLFVVRVKLPIWILGRLEVETLTLLPISIINSNIKHLRHRTSSTISTIVIHLPTNDDLVISLQMNESINPWNGIQNYSNISRSQAIGGGGFYPARVMRTFCKTPGRKNIPIQAIGLSLYEEMGTEDSTQEKLGKEIVRTQWLDFSTLGKMSLLGRRILIVVSVFLSSTLHFLSSLSLLYWFFCLFGADMAYFVPFWHRTKSMIQEQHSLMPSASYNKISRSRCERLPSDSLLEHAFHLLTFFLSSPFFPLLYFV